MLNLKNIIYFFILVSLICGCAKNKELNLQEAGIKLIYPNEWRIDDNFPSEPQLVMFRISGNDVWSIEILDPENQINISSYNRTTSYSLSILKNINKKSQFDEFRTDQSHEFFILNDHGQCLMYRYQNFKPNHNIEKAFLFGEQQLYVGMVWDEKRMVMVEVFASKVYAEEAFFQIANGITFLNSDNNCTDLSPPKIDEEH